MLNFAFFDLFITTGVFAKVSKLILFVDLLGLECTLKFIPFKSSRNGIGQNGKKETIHS